MKKATKVTMFSILFVLKNKRTSWEFSPARVRQAKFLIGVIHSSRKKDIRSVVRKETPGKKLTMVAVFAFLLFVCYLFVSHHLLIVPAFSFNNREIDGGDEI